MATLTKAQLTAMLEYIQVAAEFEICRAYGGDCTQLSITLNEREAELQRQLVQGDLPSGEGGDKELDSWGPSSV